MSVLVTSLLKHLIAPSQLDDDPIGVIWTVAGDGPTLKLNVNHSVVLVPHTPVFNSRSDSLYMRSETGNVRVLDLSVVKETGSMSAEFSMREVETLAQLSLDRFFGERCYIVREAPNMDVLTYYSLPYGAIPSVKVWSDDGRSLGCLWSFQAVLDCAACSSHSGSPDGS
jgi:hypothetical protein